MRNGFLSRMFGSLKELTGLLRGDGDSANNRTIIKQTVYGEGERFWSDRVTIYRVVEKTNDDEPILDEELIALMKQKLDRSS